MSHKKINKPHYVDYVARPYFFCENRDRNNKSIENFKCGYRFKKPEVRKFRYCPMCGVEIDWENAESNIW